MNMIALDDLEVLILDKFHLTANAFNLGEWDEGYSYPSLSDVADFAMHAGYMDRVYDKLTAQEILDSIEYKVGSIEYYPGIEDTAGWLLDHYFTEAELISMSNTEVENFLKDWKYWSGFRKCDGSGNEYKRIALAIKHGQLIYSPKIINYPEPEISYKTKSFFSA